MEVNTLFVIVVALLAISAVHGYRKGFLRMAISLFTIILVIAIVTVISPYVSNYLTNHTKVYDQLKEKVVEVFADKNEVYDNTIEENQIKTIETYELPDIIKACLIENNTTEVYHSMMVSLFEDYVAGYIARMIINAITFIGLFLMLAILMAFVIFSADIIAKIPIIKGFNKLLGMFAGLFSGLLIVWVGFFVAIIFFGNTVGTKMLTYINDSVFLTLLFNTNLLVKFISSM
ncbi:MAG TPA: CvpA family protein [Lachnospiraceae bacterium]|nr:CvpA family protein [Lachnospiraceae bacterium]